MLRKFVKGNKQLMNFTKESIGFKISGSNVQLDKCQHNDGKWNW